MKCISALSFAFIIVSLCTSCGQDNNKATEENILPVNDSAIAVQLLDTSAFKPLNILAQYNGPNISEVKKDTTLSYNLEAVLAYDEHTYGAILEKYMDADFPKGDYKKEDFNFNWLDTALKSELHLSKENYKGNPDIFLGTNGRAKLWFLDKKILVSLNQ